MISFKEYTNICCEDCYNHELTEADYKGRTEIDHIDGNPHHNDLSNLDELCHYCHRYKSQLNGDHNSWKVTSPTRYK